MRRAARCTTTSLILWVRYFHTSKISSIICGIGYSTICLSIRCCPDSIFQKLKCIHNLLDGPVLHSSLWSQSVYVGCLFQHLRHWHIDSPLLPSFMWDQYHPTVSFIICGIGTSTVRCCTRSCGTNCTTSCTTSTMSSMTGGAEISSRRHRFVFDRAPDVQLSRNPP